MKQPPFVFLQLYNIKIRLVSSNMRVKTRKMYNDMNPVFLDKRNEVFYMSKLSYEDKINLYNDRKNGMSINSLASKYKIRSEGIEYLIRLINKHGLRCIKDNKK